MSSPDREQAQIYRARAHQYHRLVMAEDADGLLLPALLARVPLAGKRVIEVGAGTGRLTKLLLDGGASVRAFEREEAMLEVAREHAPSASFEIADARSLPLEDAVADVLAAGWVYGHLRLWMPEGWKDEVSRALDEAARVLAHPAQIVIIETLGTGARTPAPPSEALAEYYAFLESRGFVRGEVATDYVFESADEAANVLGAFFGDAMRERIVREGWARVPEWTGIWVCSLP
jgi:ubiquinone/menaquinone biosynthesis C-methylase UbiE